MNDEHANTLTELKASVQRIERGMFGDEQLGHPGLVGTQKEHGSRIGRLERMGIYVTGAAGAIGLGYKVLTEWVKH